MKLNNERILSSRRKYYNERSISFYIQRIININVTEVNIRLGNFQAIASESTTN